MPITLGQLTANRKPLTITLDEDTALSVEYYPMRITSEMLVAYAAVGNVQDMTDEQALAVITSPGEMLLKLLASWDLVESIAEDGRPGPALPIAAETIGALGLPLQWGLLAAIMQDAGDQGKAKAPKGKKRA